MSARINAEAKQNHGFDRAQFRGRARMQIQALLTAAVINVKELVTVRVPRNARIEPSGR